MMRSLVVLLALGVARGNMSAQEPLAGEWRGHWFRAGDSMAVTLHVRREAGSGSYSAAFDSDRLRVMGIPFNEVRVDGCCAVTLRLQGDRTTTVFTGTVRGNLFSGELREGESVGRFAYSRIRAAAAAPAERDVTFRNGDVTLAGSLILPPGATARPAVVFVHGSGGEGRFASRFLATTFARRGIAALIFDKRGVGKSSGDWRTATPDDLAADVAAAVAFLTRETGIDSRRIGIHGHSQGGTLAPMIAARSKDVAFIIASAAAGVPTDSTEIFSILNSIHRRASTSADSANAKAYVDEIVAVAYAGRPRDRLDSLVSRFRGQPWFFELPPRDASYWSFSRVFAQYRPLEWWRQVRVPVLLIYGSEDERVPAGESAARIASEILRNAPDADVTVRILAYADHTLRQPPGPSGWPVSAPAYLPTLLSWLEAHTRVP